MVIEEVPKYGDGPWELRPAFADDIKAVEVLLRSHDLPLDGVADFLDRSYIIAETDGDVAGCAGVEIYADHGLLRSVAVAHPLQGLGLGDALVTALVDLARSNGLQTLSLLTTDASRYFRRFGFETVAREQLPEAIHQSSEFRELCPASATAMVLRLT